MTREDIIRMAREAGIEHLEHVEEMRSPMSDGVWLEDLEHFAALVAAAEREACARVVEQTSWSNWLQSDAAAAIRARGQQ